MAILHGLKVFRALFKSEINTLNFKWGTYSSEADPSEILRGMMGGLLLPTLGNNCFFVHQALNSVVLKQYDYWILTPTVILQSGESLIFCWALSEPCSPTASEGATRLAFDYCLNHLQMLLGEGIPIPGWDWKVIQCDGNIVYSVKSLQMACQKAVSHRIQNPTTHSAPFLPHSIPR